MCAAYWLRFDALLRLGQATRESTMAFVTYPVRGTVCLQWPGSAGSWVVFLDWVSLD